MFLKWLDPKTQITERRNKKLGFVIVCDDVKLDIQVTTFRGGVKVKSSCALYANSDGSNGTT